MIQNILQQNGLTEKEARVYCACLELGPNIVSEIGKKAGINRVTTYDILDKLIKKGMVNFYNKEGAKYFSPTDPEVVIHEIKRKTSELEKALPYLKSLYGTTKHPYIQFFEGIDGIKTIYADTLTSTTEILNYANSREIRIHWPNYDEEYVSQRAQRKIMLHGIAPDDEYGKTVQASDWKYYRETRLVPSDQFTFTNEINVYDDKVAITSFKEELIGMIIESLEIAHTQRDIFKMAWTFAGMLSKKKR